MSAKSLVEGFPVVVELPVQWGDMDAYGHVNNVVFFRYFESARVAYLVRCAFTSSYEEHRVGAILHSTSCRFRRPLFYPDRVLSAARLAGLGEDRFEMEYRVVSFDQDAVVAEGTGVVVSFDYEARTKVPIPDGVLRGIEELEGGLPEA